MTYAGVAECLCEIKIAKEEVSPECISERGSVVTVVLVKPLFHSNLVGVCQLDAGDALVHLYILVSISSDGLHTVLHCEVDIGGTNAVSITKKFTEYIVLPLAAKSAASTKFCILEVIYFSAETVQLTNEFFSRALFEHFIVILGLEVNLVYYLKKINLKLHYGEHRSVYIKNHTARGNIAIFLVEVVFICFKAMYIAAERSPKTKKLNIVRLDKTKRVQIIKLLVSERESAEVVDLGIDFLNHFISKSNTFISAFEDVDTIEVGVFVEHDLVHIELVEVSIEEGYNARG